MSEPLQNDKSNNRKSVESTIQPEYDATTDYNIQSQCDKDASHQCKHPTHSHFKTAAFVNILPPEYWAVYGEETLSGGTDEAPSTDQANRAINQAFIKRLQELENRAPNAVEAKLETYKDWVLVLQRLNKVLLKDFDEFEKTIEDHLQAHEVRSNFNYRRDVATLVRLIRQAYHDNNWSLADMKFETMTQAFVMGLDENNAHDKMILSKLQTGEYQTQKEQRKKLSATDMNVMALAVEVADKHDEIIKLKEQLCCLEDEIQNAQKKIKLKDDVIRELRLDLKNFNKTSIQESTSNTSLISANSTLDEMAAVSTGNLLSKSPPMSNVIVKKLNTCDSKGIAENLDYLRNQLQEILTTSGWQIESSKNEAERLQEIFTKLEADKTEAFGRLKKIKEHLLDLLTPNQKEEQNFILNNNDEMFIQAVRDHFDSINLAHKELSQQVQQLLIEKGETAGKLEALNNINRINCDALKELADLLSSLTNEAFNYNEIYNSKPTYNPFCQAICSIQSRLSKTIEDLTAQLAEEKDKYRKNELEMAQLEKSNDGASSTKFCRIRNTSRIPQTTTSQRLHSTAPTPHPRQKSKPLDRKNLVP